VLGGEKQQKRDKRGRPKAISSPHCRGRTWGRESLGGAIKPEGDVTEKGEFPETWRKGFNGGNLGGGKKCQNKERKRKSRKGEES